MNSGQDTRQRILDSACSLIYARSYAEVGVAAICEKAGVKKGSFYHFFPSKRDLTLAVIDELLLEFKRRIYAGAFDPFLSPMSRFRKLGELVYRFQKEIADTTGQILGCPFGNIALEMSSQDEVLRCKIEAIFSQMEGLFRKTLSAAVVQGEIGEIDIDATASAMIAYIEGVMLMAKTRNDPEVIKTLMPAVLDIRIAPQEMAESLDS
jgi:TetR/AcrR family transcriptional repressor of nem operon